MLLLWSWRGMLQHYAWYSQTPLTHAQLYGRRLDPGKAPLRNLRQARHQCHEASMLRQHNMRRL